MEKYEVDRKCTDCGFEVKAFLTKREAAFQLFDTRTLFGPTCQKCGGNQSSDGFTLPTLDKELISEWIQNKDLHFLSQDEELILGTGEYFGLIIEALDSPQILVNKKYILLYALCIMVYDNTIEDGMDWEPDDSLKRRAIEELNKRKGLLIEAGDWIMDYVQRVVYPQLDVSWPEKN